MKKTRTLSTTLAVGLSVFLAFGAISCRGNRNENSAAANSNANTISNITSPSTDTALRNTVEANLTRYGVTGVTVDVSNGEVTLRGSIPRAKLQDAMKAANEANPKRVNNQMNIQ